MEATRFMFLRERYRAGFVGFSMLSPKPVITEGANTDREIFVPVKGRLDFSDHASSFVMRHEIVSDFEFMRGVVNSPNFRDGEIVLVPHKKHPVKAYTEAVLMNDAVGKPSTLRRKAKLIGVNPDQYSQYELIGKIKGFAISDYNDEVFLTWLQKRDKEAYNWYMQRYHGYELATKDSPLESELETKKIEEVK